VSGAEYPPGTQYPPGAQYPPGTQYPPDTQYYYPQGSSYPPGSPYAYSSGPVEQAKGKDRTNLYGWLGIVIGFLCCAIVGIVLGVLSIRDAKRFGNAPTLGYVAIALSIVNVVVGTIYAYRR
jgi:hypothetical protein